MTRLHVEHAGASTLVEDLGRPGLAHLGVAASGALDRKAFALANRLVGNSDGAAALEVLVGGFRARFEGEAWFAVTGAWGPVTLDDRPIAPYAAARARDGSMLELGTAARGIRYVLAVRGGLDVPHQLLRVRVLGILRQLHARRRLLAGRLVLRGLDDRRVRRRGGVRDALRHDLPLGDDQHRQRPVVGRLHRR